MKKTTSAIFCTIVIGILGLSAMTATVSAQKAGYNADDYTAVTTPTVDGQWTTDTEWDDAAQYTLGGGLNAIFRLKYVIAPDFSWINQYYLIEFFGDNTNDAGDYYSICYSAATTLFGTPTGGTTPQADCWRFDYTAHSAATTLTVYKGTGTAWAVNTAWSTPTDYQVMDSIAASKLSATPHYIAEFKIEHAHFTINPTFWILVQAYDASRSASGVQTWPTGSNRDVPNDYGLMTSYQTTFPETWNIGLVLLVLSVPMVAGAYYFRKKPKAKT